MPTEDGKPDPLASQGASQADLSESQSTQGAPKAPPEPSNSPPPAKPKPQGREGLDEQHATPDQFEADGVTPKPVETPAPKPEDAPAPKPDPATEYVTMEDPAAQGAIDVLKEAGVPRAEAEKIFEKAVAAGDLSLIDWAALEAKVGPGKAFLIKAGVTTYFNNQKAIVDATVAQTHQIFNGRENFDAVKVWAQTKEKGDPAFQTKVDSIRELLNEGGVRAEAGARELLRLYNADPGTKGLGKGLVTGDTTGNVIGTPLTRADYVTALKAAHERGAKPPELEAINARRKAGMAQGI